MADVVTLFIILGVIGAIVNLLLAYIKKWEVLGVLTLAAAFPIIGVTLLDAIYGNMGFFAAVVAFAGIVTILVMTVAAVSIAGIQAILGVEEKEEVSS